MKKLLCLAAASLVGFAAFAEGPLSLTVDTKATWDGENGLGITAGDDDFILEVKGSYEAENGGAMFRLRTGELGSAWSAVQDIDPESSLYFNGALVLDRYEAWIKPNKYFKVSIGSNPVELYNEEVKWDVPFGAGIFESGKHIFAELYPVDGLTVGLGVNATYIADDAKKIQDGLAAWATYDIAATGSVSAEYESRSEKQKVIGLQFNYNGIDNMNFLVGYATLLNKNAEDKFDLAQHRVNVDFRTSNDNFAFEVFDEAILKNSDYGDFGNRFATKFSYFLNDKVTPWLRAQFFMNYGPFDWGTMMLSNGVAWSDVQLGNTPNKDDWLVVVEPKVSIDLGKGVSTVLGAQINYASYDLAEDKKLTWSIPFEIIVAF